MVLLVLGEAEEVAGDGQDGGVELPAVHGEARVEVEERAGRGAGAEAEDGEGGAREERRERGEGVEVGGGERRARRGNERVWMLPGSSRRRRRAPASGWPAARGDTSATRMWLCGERTSVTSWRTCALSVHVIGSIPVNMCHVR